MVPDAGSERKDGPEVFCTVCVYGMGQLDPEEFSGGRLCGLDCTPGDELCLEMRTQNCSLRKRAS